MLIEFDDIKHNLKIVQDRVESACSKANRNPNGVRLLLATKTVAAERIKIAFECGYTLIGENKVQELKEKFDALKEDAHERHFIGHLQTNKIKDVLKYGVDCIQSLDRIELAEKLHQRLLFENKTIDVLVQVNTSGEESKFGLAPEDAVSFIKNISSLHTLRIKGLMTIALFSAEAEKVRPCFKLLKNLSDEIRQENIPGVEMTGLSMGMSGDLETAIEEGATIIRVGTAVFGPRINPDSYYWNEKATPMHGTK